MALRLLAGAAIAGPVWAQGGWPSRPLRLVVGFPPGSSPDLTARALADPLAQALGQPVVVENRPGAGGNIAADVVARARDEHTLGLMINGNLTIAKLLNPATPYDPFTDLAPVSLIGTAPLLPPGLAMPQVQSGRLRAVGLTSAGRSTLAPGVPSLAEVGLRGFELEIWNAVAAPATLPAERIRRVAEALADIVRRPDVRQKLFSQGWQVAGTSPEALARRMRDDTARLKAVIERNGIRAQ
ncbi:MAG: tripartite tricarboxylate transporter substrate-binding protein [Tepidimonas taiwanensis]|nr:tripartite tricarboxylate transporter substrate-binding protein [Tepidimonas taiwanensis]